MGKLYFILEEFFIIFFFKDVEFIMIIINISM